MIMFLGLVPFIRKITLRVAMETMRFEPSPNRFIVGQLNLANYCVLINNLAPIRNCPRFYVT